MVAQPVRLAPVEPVERMIIAAAAVAAGLAPVVVITAALAADHLMHRATALILYRV